MRKWLLALGMAVVIGCSTPTPEPPPSPPTPIRTPYQPPAYISYQSVAEIVKANILLNVPNSGVECYSINMYHKLGLELVSCAVRERTGDAIFVTIATYDMNETEILTPLRALVLVITPAQMGVYGTVLSCISIYEAYDNFEQNCDYEGRMLMEEFMAHVLDIGVTIDNGLKERNNALP